MNLQERNYLRVPSINKDRKLDGLNTIRSSSLKDRHEQRLDINNEQLAQSPLTDNGIEISAVELPYHNRSSQVTHLSRAPPLRIALVNPGIGRMFNLDVLGGQLAGHYMEKIPDHLEVIGGISVFKGETIEIYFVAIEEEKDTSDGILEKLENINPDIVGVAMRIGSLPVTEPIIKQSLQRGRVVVCGQTQALHAYDHLLKRYPNAIMVINEGEEALCGISDAVRKLRGNTLPGSMINIAELKAELQAQNIPNIAFIMSEGNMAPITERRFDGSKAYPLLRNERIIKYLIANRHVVDFEFNRGCSSNRCPFCSLAKMRARCHDKRHYHRPVQQVIDDFRWLYSRGVRVFNCVSEDFIPDSNEPGELRAVDELIDELIGLRKNEGMDINFFITTRVRSVFIAGDLKGNIERRQRYENLKRAGCIGVFVGIESGSPEQLKRYAKDSNVFENESAIEVLTRIGMAMPDSRVQTTINKEPMTFRPMLSSGFMMFDLLMEDVREILDNIAFVRRTMLTTNYGDSFDIFNICRVEAGSALVKLVEKAEQSYEVKLLGELDINTLNYDIVGYLNPDVFRITEHVRAWQKKCDSFNRKVQSAIQKGIVAEEERDITGDVKRHDVQEYFIADKNMLVSYSIGLRMLELDMLKDMTLAVMNGADDTKLGDVVAIYDSIRFAMIADIENKLISGKIRDETGELINETQFLRRDNIEDFIKAKDIGSIYFKPYLNALHRISEFQAFKRVYYLRPSLNKAFPTFGSFYGALEDIDHYLDEHRESIEYLSLVVRELILAIRDPAFEIGKNEFSDVAADIEYLVQRAANFLTTQEKLSEIVDGLTEIVPRKITHKITPVISIEGHLLQVNKRMFKYI
ncbi:MAG: radical SAM protein [Candidatus Omnitrophica bacterium]|nr:radical SAM protein [Candidatus Omnitrophota bacterium]